MTLTVEDEQAIAQMTAFGCGRVHSHIDVSLAPAGAAIGRPGGHAANPHIPVTVDDDASDRQLMFKLWLTAVLRALVMVVGSFLLAAAIGIDGRWAILGPAAYVVWHIVQLRRMSDWLQATGDTNPPDMPGLWGVLGARLRGMISRERKREQHLQATLRGYQESTAAMPDATVVLNDHREILWFNEAAHTLLGLQHPVDLGQRIDSLLRFPQFAEYLQTEGFEEPLEMLSPLDSRLHLSLHVIRYGAGQKLLLFRDNTRLYQLESVRRKFVANASHELRSPLTVIAGYLEQMRDDEQLMQQWDRPLEQMQRQATRMTAIIHDLLDLSRMEASTATAAYTPVDVHRLLQDIVSAVRSSPGPSPSIKTLLDSATHLLGSERELHSLFANLLSNAIKYTPPEGTVTVSWSQEQGAGVYRVSDTGVGIAPEHIPRLTERFYRVDKGRAREDGGTGLGLAIVKHVLQRHDGELQVLSEEGAGSQFICRFPMARIVTQVGCEPASRGLAVSVRDDAP